MLRRPPGPRVKAPAGRPCRLANSVSRMLAIVGATSSGSIPRRPVLPIEAGTWWWLFDGYMRIPGDKTHPWIFIVDYEPRRALAHACLRTSTHPAASELRIEHAPHAEGHEATCRLNRTGWILPRLVRPISLGNIHVRERNCLEPDSGLVSRIRGMR